MEHNDALRVSLGAKAEEAKAAATLAQMALEAATKQKQQDAAGKAEADAKAARAAKARAPPRPPLNSPSLSARSPRIHPKPRQV